MPMVPGTVTLCTFAPRKGGLTCTETTFSEITDRMELGHGVASWKRIRPAGQGGDFPAGRHIPLQRGLELLSVLRAQVNHRGLCKTLNDCWSGRGI